MAVEGTRVQPERGTVYVIGAGFSAGLGFPLTKSLLIDVWGRLDAPARERLQEIISFHHCDSRKSRSY